MKVCSPSTISSTGPRRQAVLHLVRAVLPHTPHSPPERLLKKYEGSGVVAPVARYCAMIEWLDETVGELLGHLERRRVTENIIVVYLADNAWIQSPAPKPAQPTRGKMSPYDAGIRTPIIVRWPGRAAAVRDERTLAGSIDVVPTLLNAAGITPPADLPGRDLLDSRAMARRKELFGSLFMHTAVYTLLHPLRRSRARSRAEIVGAVERFRHSLG